MSSTTIWRGSFKRLRVRAKISPQIFSVQALTQQGAKMMAYRDIPAFSQHC
jgi:hypothetical protein